MKNSVLKRILLIFGAFIVAMLSMFAWGTLEPVKAEEKQVSACTSTIYLNNDNFVPNQQYFNRSGFKSVSPYTIVDVFNVSSLNSSNSLARLDSEELYNRVDFFTTDYAYGSYDISLKFPLDKFADFGFNTRDDFIAFLNVYYSYSGAYSHPDYGHYYLNFSPISFFSNAGGYHDYYFYNDSVNYLTINGVRYSWNVSTLDRYFMKYLPSSSTNRLVSELVFFDLSLFLSDNNMTLFDFIQNVTIHLDFHMSAGGRFFYVPFLAYVDFIQPFTNDYTFYSVVDVGYIYDVYARSDKFRGLNNSLALNFTDGYKRGYDAGKIDGFNKGWQEGVDDSSTYSFLGLMGSVVDVPISAFSNLFNFELLGINLKDFILGLFTICVIVTILRLTIK